MKKSIYLSTLCFLILFSTLKSYSQFYVSSEIKDDLDGLANSKLYVIIDTKAHDNNAKYGEIFKKVWTLSEVEIIEPDEIADKLKVGNYFFSISYSYPENFNLNKPIKGLVHFYYKLWTPDKEKLEEYMNKVQRNKKADINSIIHYMASFSLAYNHNVSFKVNDILSGEYFGNEYNLYGGVGLFKNYIQALQLAINNDIVAWII